MVFPSGVIPNPSDKSEEKLGAFDELGVDDVYREETYLAALIFYWICIFALPIHELGLIRLGTFLTTSLIAEGIRVCLALLVLASIYRGLNGIANSSQPSKGCHAFLTYYIYVWLAQYFNRLQLTPPRQPNSTMGKFSGSSSVISFVEISAREHIMRRTNFAWHSTSFAFKKQHIFSDDHSLSSFKFNYFMNLRSSYLSLRCEDLYVVEIYSPHRFSRQFGFYQDLLGEHSEELPASVLERMYQLYSSCTRVGTKSKVSVPV
ncbi:hypothetical protein ACH5RR_018045 [Cinchona calisaya]|uniref:Aminotransferase-like plant mobile domain-containing protein n=1 Tax=Cinchona calisaya TaxID=153742 RepID=A0ABD2ZM03_9GENT